MKKLHNYSLVMRLFVNLLCIAFSGIIFFGLREVAEVRFANIGAAVFFIYAFFIFNFLLTYHLRDQSNR